MQAKPQLSDRSKTDRRADAGVYCEWTSHRPNRSAAEFP